MEGLLISVVFLLGWSEAQILAWTTFTRAIRGCESERFHAILQLAGLFIGGKNPLKSESSVAGRRQYIR